jgi:hypothetical protein
VRVRLDGRELGVVSLDGTDVPSLALPPGLAAGEHVVTLRAEPAAALSADLRVSWRTAGDPTPVSAGLDVAIEVPEAPIAVGHLADLEVSVRNPGREAVAMPTVIAPVPPGFRADRDSLERLVSGKVVARFEDQGSEIYLYLTRLAPGERVELPYRLEATAECSVAQRPAQAYAYYSPELRGASAAARLRGAPRP